MNQQQSLNKIIIITGATCTGKSLLGVAICKKFHGEVINCDPAQFYTDFSVGVGKLTVCETQFIRHHMHSFLDAHEQYNVCDFVTTTRKIIADIIKRNKIPIIVGGSGLYIYWLIYPMLRAPRRDPSFARRYDKHTNKQLHRLLCDIDPLSSRRLHFNNRRRVLRAIEIYHRCKLTKSELEALSPLSPRFNYLLIELVHKTQAFHHQLVKQRISWQLKNGFINEVISIEQRFPSQPHLPIKQIMGYHIVANHLYNNTPISVTSDELFTKTKQLIKKQKTFFKNKFLNNHYYSTTNQDSLPNVNNLIRKFLG